MRLNEEVRGCHVHEMRIDFLSPRKRKFASIHSIVGNMNKENRLTTSPNTYEEITTTRNKVVSVVTIGTFLYANLMKGDSLFILNS